MYRLQESLQSAVDYINTNLILTLLWSDPELLYATGLDNHGTHAGAAGSCCVNACIARSTTSRFPKPDRPAASITGTRIEGRGREIEGVPGIFFKSPKLFSI